MVKRRLTTTGGCQTLRALRSLPTGAGSINLTASVVLASAALIASAAAA
jgi:hypothetical protein